VAENMSRFIARGKGESFCHFRSISTLVFILRQIKNSKQTHLILHAMCATKSAGEAADVIGAEIQV
jgi:hypothetical protein